MLQCLHESQLESMPVLLAERPTVTREPKTLLPTTPLYASAVSQDQQVGTFSGAKPQAQPIGCVGWMITGAVAAMVAGFFGTTSTSTTPTAVPTAYNNRASLITSSSSTGAWASSQDASAAVGAPPTSIYGAANGTGSSSSVLGNEEPVRACVVQTSRGKAPFANDADALLAKGVEHLKRGDLDSIDKAIFTFLELYNRSTKEDPRRLMARNNLGCAFLAKAKALSKQGTASSVSSVVSASPVPVPTAPAQAVADELKHCAAVESYLEASKEAFVADGGSWACRLIPKPPQRAAPRKEVMSLEKSTLPK
jgi:hypothetical protein